MLPEGAGGTPAAAGGTPPATPPTPAGGTPTTTPPASGAGGTPPGGDDLAEIRSALTRERELREIAQREAGETKARLTELEAKATADLPELDRVKRERDELKAANAERDARDRNRELRLASLEAATKLGFASPELAWRLVDTDKLEWSTDGTPKGLDATLRTLLEKHPELGTQPKSPDLGGGPRGTPNDEGAGMNELIRAAAGRG